MSFLTPSLIILVFLCMAGLMYTRRVSALLALPIMALAIAVIGGIPGHDILTEVVGKGSMKLHNAYTTTMFGAILAELMNRQGIARALVRWVAEFAGDNPYILASVLTLVTALLFSTLGGLGAVIMVGTIVLPVMLSLGVSSATAGALYLFGISLGGMFNLANWALYIDVLGVAKEKIIAFVIPFSCLIAVVILLFLALELKSWKNFIYLGIGSAFSLCAAFFLSRVFEPSAAGAAAANLAVLDASFNLAVGLVVLLSLYAWRRQSAGQQSQSQGDIPGFALLTPVVPLLLVLGCGWEIISAFVFAIIYGVLATWSKASINQITRSIIDGITTVIPAVFLMVGIGMLINAVSNEAVAGAIKPLIASVIPTDPIRYVLVFTLMAPLALYRGPLSLWGMGSGLVKLIQTGTALSGQAIMGMLMSVGQVQGICDPTNTHNIWIATYLGTDTHALLKKTILFAWLAVVGGLVLACCLGYV
ncbi:citrate transporter [bacterium]|nr:citrate transporter [bacterium]